MLKPFLVVGGSKQSLGAEARSKGDGEGVGAFCFGVDIVKDSSGSLWAVLT